jgi:hypothetical protein
MSKFSRLADALSKKPGVYSPGGLAATIAAHKYGRRRLQKAARLRKPISRVR